MTLQIEAVYEQGVLKPLAPLTLDEGTRVEITLVTQPPSTRTPYEILSAIAALPLEVEREERAGRDHDHYLYRNADSGEHP
ncbi:MAG: antitoxin family protein [Acidobacteria bacterium]|nr:antitoxin family protein [Acidobacteriota bacterium]